jgi:nitrite reductase (NADH) small subunit/3-phenylpropionate/trans-cinnamate dioxygenase ferredoxin subunit
MARRIEVARMKDLRADRGHCIEVEGRAIALFLKDGKVFAMDDRCPHAGGPLGAGHVSKGIVMCPWHGWRFRVEDGVWADAPHAGLAVRCYPVVQSEDEVWIEVDW